MAVATPPPVHDSAVVTTSFFFLHILPSFAARRVTSSSVIASLRACRDTNTDSARRTRIAHTGGGPRCFAPVPEDRRIEHRVPTRREEGLLRPFSRGRGAARRRA